MMRRNAFRFIFAVVLGLTLFDSVADAAGCDDSKAAAAVCHACSCGPHLVTPGIIEIVVAPASVQHVSYTPPSYSFLLPASIFRPPCLGA